MIPSSSNENTQDQNQCPDCTDVHENTMEPQGSGPTVLEEENNTNRDVREDAPEDRKGKSMDK